MQRSNNGRGKPLFGVNAVVCSKKEKIDKKLEERTQKGLDRADIVRDYRLICDFPGLSVAAHSFGARR
jgi:hypothetical protein